MNTFEPVINLLVLMSALSITAERLANVVKPPKGTFDETRRRRIVANRTLVVSVLVAIALKADFFAILSHLDAPWETLGWGQLALRAPAGIPSAVAGSMLTGISLGFGSKFWHDVLDVVYGARDRFRGVRDAAQGRP